MQAVESPDTPVVEWPHINSVWVDSIQLPDVREIYEWAADEIDLPNCYAVTGKFDADRVPFVKAPFEALKNPSIRRVVCQSGVQCLKTLVGEIWLLYTIDQSPGPSQWLQTTNDESDAHYAERFSPLIESCPRVHKYFTERQRDKKSTRIKFKHMYLLMEGAFEKGNVQRKSIKNQMCSEVWQAKFWPKGRLDEAGTRQTQFNFNSKQYIESQAGFADDDMDLAYKAGTQEVWHFSCLSCGFYQPFKWSHFREDGSRAAMRWEDSPKTRRENGEWRWNELFPTIRYECIKCGFGHTDDPLTRRRLTVSGKYITQNKDASPDTRSFTWGQLAMDNLSWFETKTGGVKRFLIANEEHKRGNDGPLREFFQKVVPEPYDPTLFFKFNRPPVATINTEWPEEYIRPMTVDAQEDCFWAVIRAWAKSGESRLLWAGKLLTWQEVADKQIEFKVYDGQVYVDCSDQTRTVYEQCVAHGHLERMGNKEVWISWKGLNGDARRSFAYTTKGRVRIDLPYSWPESYGDPMSGKEGQGLGRMCPFVHWSNPTIKDILGKLRDGKGAKWSIYEGVTEDWNKQMWSERKIRVYDKYGQDQTKWENIGKRPNHLWDCECMQVVCAAMAGILCEPIPDSKEIVR